MGRVIQLHREITINGVPIEGDLDGAIEAEFRKALETLRANGFRRFHCQITIRGVESPKRRRRRA